MSISAVSGSTTTTTTSSSSSSSSTTSLASNYEMFMTLLLKQLEVQDPTNPVDTTEYTSQLVQYASLEQDVANGEKLDSLISAVNDLGYGSTGIGYLGRTVEASGDTTALQDGSASWEYDLDDDASSVTLTVTDENGKTVYTTTGETGEGTHSFSWDGTGSNGTTYSSGAYTLTVSAVDSAKASVGVDTRIKGTVTSVDNSSGSTVLNIGDVAIEVDDVLTVS